MTERKQTKIPIPTSLATRLISEGKVRENRPSGWSNMCDCIAFLFATPILMVALLEWNSRMKVLILFQTMLTSVYTKSVEQIMSLLDIMTLVFKIQESLQLLMSLKYKKTYLIHVCSMIDVLSGLIKSE